MKSHCNIEYTVKTQEKIGTLIHKILSKRNEKSPETLGWSICDGEAQIICDILKRWDLDVIDVDDYETLNRLYKKYKEK